RVAAASLGASHQGGIRASIGIPALERSAIRPGGPDTGRTELVVDDGGRRAATIQGTLASRALPQALGQFRGEQLRPGLAKTFDLSGRPDAAISLSVGSGEGIAAARR